MTWSEKHAGLHSFWAVPDGQLSIAQEPSETRSSQGDVLPHLLPARVLFDVFWRALLQDPMSQ
jgi:hypothetical protein